MDAQMDSLIKAYDPYVREIIARVETDGYISAMQTMAFACGCIGRQAGEPECPCAMRDTAMAIVAELRKIVVADKFQELREAVDTIA